MSALILLHVLAAVIGVGPTFFSHVLMRKNQTVGELRQSIKLSKRLELFPKIGGSLAVLSGLLLVILSDAYVFQDFWVWGSITLYVLIQIVVIGVVAPRSKKVADWLASSDLAYDAALPAEQESWLRQANGLLYIATFMGVLLFVFMFMKPLL